MIVLPLLALFNRLVPKDKGSRRLAQGIPYGPDERHRLDVYGPVSIETRLPVIQFIHGGSWNSGSRSDYAFAGRALAALGYLVVIADYRVLPEIEYPDFLSDCAAAFAWLAGHIGEFGGDPERVALVGHSAGAYNAVMLALDPRYLGSNGLAARVRAIAGISGPYDFFPFDAPISLRTFGAVRDGASTQPIRYVSAEAPPMLLATGDRDRLVHPRNTVAMAGALTALGVPVVERHYPRLGHSITVLMLARLVRALAPVRDDLADFLAVHLAGTAHSSARADPESQPAENRSRPA